MPIFSVITPAYNAAATIASTIQSIQAQTIKDWEHIIVNDGSTDRTAEIVEKYSVLDSRLRLFSLPNNQGISAARNFAIEKANGEFLAFLDADDQALPQRLERQYQTLSQNIDLAGVGSAVELFGDMHKTIIPSTEPITIAIHMLFHCDVFFTSTTIRKNIQSDLESWFNPEYTLGEDWEFLSRLIRLKRINNIPEILTRYRRSKTQITAELINRIDDKAATLRLNQLIWLGMSEDEVDLEAHIAVSPCHWPLKRDVAASAFEIERVTDWINKLIIVNNINKRYPPERFQQILFKILEDYRAIH